MTREEKNHQIKREAMATAALFLLCFLWHVGFAYGLSGLDIRVFHLPLWWVVSTPGVFVVAVVGLAILLKTVFRDFDLDDGSETLAGTEAGPGEVTTHE